MFVKKVIGVVVVIVWNSLGFGYKLLGNYLNKLLFRPIVSFLKPLFLEMKHQRGLKCKLSALQLVKLSTKQHLCFFSFS